ncbi:hypothetical protein Glove_197g75 [Diversispora epigaea]|uniref:Actin-related protein 2/3 complex subunit n=1 Tax=Diversispora epigaea TaxID=1348612 RepID=A0A397IKN7_9GLOM|nr:hypothetical protein Glove_197g75 [Diversispora epigaea]
MSQTEIRQFNFGPITTHAFNKDRTQVAICPNNNEVQIHQRTAGGWSLIHTLVEHDKLVTSIDWAVESNQIVTCSQDRNAYVWNFDQTNGKWKPTLVLLRFNRAATFVRWSPNETKFAVASGARCIAVCYFDEVNDWWNSKHLKKPIRSTVLSLDWHSNNILLAAGCADFKARVFSAYIKGVDQRPAPTPWGDKLPFNTVCGEFSNGGGGWIHSVAFLPSGDALAITGHDSQITIIYPGQESYAIKTNNLPFLSLLWVNENQLIAAGYDCVPILFERQNDQSWEFSKILDASSKKKNINESSTAFNRFRDLDARGISSRSGSDETELKTIHQNTITSLRPYNGTPGDISHFSSSGLDGRLVIWNFQSLESQFKGLKV